MIKKIIKSVLGMINGAKYPVFNESEMKSIPNQSSIAFVIPSTIDISRDSLNYSTTRTIYSTEDRLRQTIKSIESIREKVPGAHIFLSEGGKTDFKEQLASLVDHYMYLGNENVVRSAVDSKLKNLGEMEILLRTFPLTASYDFTFKLSGRYWLSEDFDLANYDSEHMNFKNYVPHRTDFPFGPSSYIKGSHSTRLFSVPKSLHPELMDELNRILPDIKSGSVIEKTIGKYIKGKYFFYIRQLGCAGFIAVNGDEIRE